MLDLKTLDEFIYELREKHGGREMCNLEESSEKVELIEIDLSQEELETIDDDFRGNDESLFYRIFQQIFEALFQLL